MRKLLHSEYLFTRKIDDTCTAVLTCYVNYKNKTYDIVQDCEEGIFIKHNNSNTKINLAYIELAKEALLFVEEELYFKD